MFDKKVDFKEVLNPCYTNFEVIEYYYNLYLNETDIDKKCALFLKLEKLLKVEVIKND